MILLDLKLFELTSGDTVFIGADQGWYATERQRMGGCGPTAASNLLWYLSRRDGAYHALCGSLRCQKEEMQKLMQRVWEYVTPGRFGLNEPGMMTRGLVRYGMDHQVPLQCDVLEVPGKSADRPAWSAVQAFVRTHLGNHLPIAFLNLSNGDIQNLDNWHWVTLAGLDEDTHEIIFLDAGKTDVLNLNLWYETTLLGGAFVSFSQ